MGPAAKGSPGFPGHWAQPLGSGGCRPVTLCTWARGPARTRCKGDEGENDRQELWRGI